MPARIVADWDSDGVPDLLVGAGDGSVSLFRNVGTAQAPKLAAAETIVPAGEASFGADAPKKPRRGIRSKVCAADWNGEAGSTCSSATSPPRPRTFPNPTPEQKTKHAEIRKQLAKVEGRYRELVQKVFGPDRAKTKKETDKVQKRWRKSPRRCNRSAQSFRPSTKTTAGSGYSSASPRGRDRQPLQRFSFGFIQGGPA